MKIEWKEPTPQMHDRGFPPVLDWFAVAAALKERPGQFALVGRGIDRQHTTRINKGLNSAFRDGKYQATVRGCGKYDNPKHGDLFIRYIGPLDE